MSYRGRSQANLPTPPVKMLSSPLRRCLLTQKVLPKGACASPLFSLQKLTFAAPEQI
jgi:hypothetical protein